jgi:hypothetical protein
MNKQDFDFDKLFGGKFLKASDIDEETNNLIVTVKDWDVQELGQGKEEKLTISFRETDKELVLNKTNGGTLASLYGKDPDGWIGRKIALYATEVDFAGKTTLAVRIRVRAPKLAVQPQPRPEPMGTDANGEPPI